MIICAAPDIVNLPTHNIILSCDAGLFYKLFLIIDRNRSRGYMNSSKQIHAGMQPDYKINSSECLKEDKDELPRVFHNDINCVRKEQVLKLHGKSLAGARGWRSWELSDLVL